MLTSPDKADLGRGGCPDGPELRWPVPGSDPQLQCWPVDQEVRVVRGEYLHCHSQGPLALRHQVLVLGEGSLQLWLQGK